MNRTAGDIEYELTLKRIKNINMRVGTDGSVRVSAPYGSDREFIDRFVLSRREFIENARRRIGSRAPVPEPDASRLEIYKRLYAVMRSVYPRFSEYGFAMPQLRIRAMTSQWGNCRRERRLVRKDHLVRRQRLGTGRQYAGRLHDPRNEPLVRPFGGHGRVRRRKGPARRA